jgi:hypothetical protein
MTRFVFAFDSAKSEAWDYLWPQFEILVVLLPRTLIILSFTIPSQPVRDFGVPVAVLWFVSPPIPAVLPKSRIPAGQVENTGNPPDPITTVLSALSNQ